MSTDNSKLPPQLEKIRDELAESGSQNGPYQSYSSNSFKTGFNVCYHVLLNSDAGEFDENAANEYSSAKFPCEPPCDSYGICSDCGDALCFWAGAKWQHKQNSATIAALKAENESLKWASRNTTSYPSAMDYAESLEAKLAQLEKDKAVAIEALKIEIERLKEIELKYQELSR